MVAHNGQYLLTQCFPPLQIVLDPSLSVYVLNFILFELHLLPALLKLVYFFITLAHALLY